jgi:hypothetical protein
VLHWRAVIRDKRTKVFMTLYETLINRCHKAEFNKLALIIQLNCNRCDSLAMVRCFKSDRIEFYSSHPSSKINVFSVRDAFFAEPFLD